MVTSAALQPYERFILALADGALFTQAATAAGLRSAQAMREAKAFGWPDRDRIRQAAQDIRHDHSREETPVPPRRTREPIPIERDVEEAMTAGAALLEEARASVALDRDRDGTVDVGPVVVGRRLDNWETSERGIPADLDAVVDHTDQHETAQAPKPCHHHLHHLDKHLEAGDHVSAHGIWGTAIQCPGCRDALVLDPDELQPASVEAINRELIDDSAEVLQLVDRLQPGRLLLDAVQRARVAAVREAGDIVLGYGATVAELLAVADFIDTGHIGGDR